MTIPPCRWCGCQECVIYNPITRLGLSFVAHCPHCGARSPLATSPEELETILADDCAAALWKPAE